MSVFDLASKLGIAHTEKLLSIYHPCLSPWQSRSGSAPTEGKPYGTQLDSCSGLSYSYTLHLLPVIHPINWHVNRRKCQLCFFFPKHSVIWKKKKMQFVFNYSENCVIFKTDSWKIFVRKHLHQDCWTFKIHFLGLECPPPPKKMVGWKEAREKGSQALFIIRANTTASGELRKDSTFLRSTSNVFLYRYIGKPSAQLNGMRNYEAVSGYIVTIWGLGTSKLVKTMVLKTPLKINYIGVWNAIWHFYTACWLSGCLCFLHCQRFYCSHIAFLLTLFFLSR